MSPIPLVRLGRDCLVFQSNLTIASVLPRMFRQGSTDICRWGRFGRGEKLVTVA